MSARTRVICSPSRVKVGQVFGQPVYFGTYIFVCKSLGNSAILIKIEYSRSNEGFRTGLKSGAGRTTE